MRNALKKRVPRPLAMDVVGGPAALRVVLVARFATATRGTPRVIRPATDRRRPFSSTPPARRP